MPTGHSRLRLATANRVLGVLLALSALSSCHDAPRSNPMDPQLTPAVTLTVATDDTTGVATLTWTRYAGPAPFAQYVVLRNAVRSSEVVPLATIIDPARTSYLDTSRAPATAYEYQVAVRNNAGLDIPSIRVQAAPYAAGAVSVAEVQVDSTAGAAALTWNRYSGGRFEAYQVERRPAEADEYIVVGNQANPRDTTFVDSGLAPDQGYYYRVVVRAAGLSFAGPRTGRVGFGLRAVQMLPPGTEPAQGTVTLQWRAYQGPGFEGYEVGRRVVSAEADTALTRLPGAGDTVWTDPTPRHGVAYHYSVVVMASGHRAESNPVTGQVDLQGVNQLQVAMASLTATADLRWTAYRGPRFGAYRLDRRTTETDWTTLGQRLAVNDTTWADVGLFGDTDYTYRVVVITDQGEQVAGAKTTRSFHRLVASWPLPLAQEETVRLDTEGGYLTALVAGTEDVHRLTWDLDGQLVSRVAVLSLPMPAIQPPSVGQARDHDGSWLLVGMSGTESAPGDALHLLRFDQGDRLVTWPRSPFADSLATVVPSSQPLAGSVELSCLGGAVINEVQIRRGSEVLFRDDFSSGSPRGWQESVGGEVVAGGFTARQVPDPNLSTAPRGTLMGGDPGWGNVTVDLEAEIGATHFRVVHATGQKPDWIPGQVTLFAGSHDRTLPSLSLVLSAKNVSLSYKIDGRSKTLYRRLPSLLATRYHFSLGLVSGIPFLTMDDPAAWSRLRSEPGGLTSLSVVDGGPVVTEGRLAWDLADGQTARSLPELAAAPSSARTWGPAALPWLGLCQPEHHWVALVRLERGRNGLSWPFGSSGQFVLGNGSGVTPGALLFPLSFAPAADGRIYVLDAGNGRLEVFGNDRQYITGFGRRGRGEHEFDFGSGTAAGDFRGDVVVDAEGFIYVVDPGNQRIQKFAP